MCERCQLSRPLLPEGVLCARCAADLRRALGRPVPYANLEAYWLAYRETLGGLRIIDLNAASLDRRAGTRD
jgi:hypothetical protein